MPHPPASNLQTVVACGVMLVGLAMAGGAVSIPSAAGYGGVGPNFLPWLVSIALIVCGAFMVLESRTGGFRAMGEADGLNRIRPCWSGFAWVSAGLLVNAALITTIGFILSCTLCFVLAVQGLRTSNGTASFKPAALFKNALIGMAIAAPVYWMFTKFLAINLPGLTSTGWL